MKRLSFLKVLGVGAAAIAAPSVFVNKENTKFIDSDSLKDGYNSKWDSSPTTIPAYSQFDKNVISTAAHNLIWYDGEMCRNKEDLVKFLNQHHRF